MDRVRNYLITQKTVHFPVLYVGYSQVALFPKVQVREFLYKKKKNTNAKVSLSCTEKF